jgi:hypothetical protein
LSFRALIARTAAAPRAAGRSDRRALGDDGTIWLVDVRRRDPLIPNIGQPRKHGGAGERTDRAVRYVHHVVQLFDRSLAPRRSPDSLDQPGFANANGPAARSADPTLASRSAATQHRGGGSEIIGSAGSR